MPDKKRKQTNENTDRPSKKRATEATSQTVNFSILQNVGDWAPVIGMSTYFPRWYNNSTVVIYQIRMFGVLD